MRKVFSWSSIQLRPIHDFLSDSRSQLESENKVITNITDKGQDQCRRMRDQYRRVKQIKDKREKSSNEWRWMWDECRQIQTKRDECYLSFMSPESPTVFTFKRTGEFEIWDQALRGGICAMWTYLLLHHS